MTYQNIYAIRNKQMLLNPVICLVLLLNHFRIVQNYKFYEDASSQELERNFVGSDYSAHQQLNRRDRDTNVKSIINGHVYSFQNAGNDLYLTSILSYNGNMPANVALYSWRDQASQLWEATTLKPNQGFALKPLANEFNSITSQIVHKAHSYHPWEFETANAKPNGKWIVKIFSSGKPLCLGTLVKNPVKTITTLMKCDPRDAKQLWTIVDRS